MVKSKNLQEMLEYLMKKNPETGAHTLRKLMKQAGYHVSRTTIDKKKRQRKP